MDEQEIDIIKLKYVLYARKSTDDPQRQVRSSEDQIAKCRQHAAWLNEEKVASYQLKPPFDEMLKTSHVFLGRGERT